MKKKELSRRNNFRNIVQFIESIYYSNVNMESVHVLNAHNVNAWFLGLQRDPCTVFMSFLLTSCVNGESYRRFEQAICPC
jgi:hypothetical protein